MGTYTLGLDLGQAQDYSALVTLENVGDRHDVVDIERYALNTPYPEIVANVAGRLQMPLLRDARLVVDATGVGRPVIDMFKAAECKPIPVMITAGSHAHRDEQMFWLVPKKELVGVVQVALQTETLKIARSLKHAQTLAQELTQFQAKITVAANEQYGQWREGLHDDLVLGLALALWQASRPTPTPAPPAQSHSFQSLAWNPSV